MYVKKLDSGYILTDSEGKQIAIMDLEILKARILHEIETPIVKALLLDSVKEMSITYDVHKNPPRFSNQP